MRTQVQTVLGRVLFPADRLVLVGVLVGVGVRWRARLLGGM